MYRKGPGQPARLGYLGHVLMENRHALVVDTGLTLATGTAEREAALEMVAVSVLLTPEERARVMQLQDLLIERFVEHREAVAEGQEERVRTVEAQIDRLLRGKGRDRE